MKHGKGILYNPSTNERFKGTFECGKKNGWGLNFKITSKKKEKIYLEHYQVGQIQSKREITLKEIDMLPFEDETQKKYEEWRQHITKAGTKKSKAKKKSKRKKRAKGKKRKSKQIKLAKSKYDLKQYSKESMFGLPLMLVLRIFSFLDFVSLCQLAQVNSIARKASENDLLWMNHCKRTFHVRVRTDRYPTHYSIWKFEYWRQVCELSWSKHIFLNPEVRHGRGSYQWTNGNKYEGEWKNNSRHGRGRMIYADGDMYEGDWSVSYTHLTLPTNREV
eukprot:TRINITY_DN1054_c0_g1_i1.p1 TRINITY_DN1054_c0_g1~~TRINITY_DN1054_c0_g1_i1.p1  ORF type:complete len:285 (+),score=39.57 TRINITY_DN1054_c0_g1_i1:28-855(+)